MAGAAWDTIIGQAVTMLAAIFYLVKKRIGFSAPQAKTLFSLFEFVLKVAVAPLGLTFSPQITTILMNRFLMIYDGEQVVAVYGCIAYVAAIAYLLLQGVGDGSQPLISRFFSEDNLPTMKQMRKYDYLTAATIGIGCFAVFFLAQNHVGILFGASVAVSYTHLDVYKRQMLSLGNTAVQNLALYLQFFGQRKNVRKSKRWLNVHMSCSIL